MQASGKDDILGKWLTPDDQAIVQIELINGEYSGKIIKLNPSTFVDGLPPKDINNVNTSLSNRSLLGVTLFKGLKYVSSEETWYIDQLYSPEHGKTYQAYIVLNNINELKLKGYVAGIKWLGRTETWTRVNGEMSF